MKLDAHVDMIEFKEYAKINLEETPVVALSCGHFFTTETLDGLIGLNNVYEIGPNGNVIGLGDTSSKLSPAIPKCPHCQRPIQQYTTHRYNRLINRAVVDEMSKRFIVTGQTAVQEIERRLIEIETILQASRQDVFRENLGPTLVGIRQRGIGEVAQKLVTRYTPALKLRSDIGKLQMRTAKHHQPAHKLHDATIHAIGRSSGLESAFGGLRLEHIPVVSERDDRIALRLNMMRVRTDGVILEDKLRIVPVVRAEYGDSASSLALFERSLAQAFFQSCGKLIAECKDKALKRIAMELSLLYAQLICAVDTAGLREPEDGEMASRERDNARNLLEEATILCEHGFHDAETLLEAVNQSLKLLRKEWYAKVTDQELEAIK
ncbi:hypothetical protein CB0940_12247 [Cercospora beticola]|uniref:Uncharacterized protein n=1 Tax=Cercospora beticola TaxID=122368 RepID=A0A2G5GQV9_CERBT|nr:hypothetical protein CB0940_12247 [Cercospora beticola]PIA82403.1 hypothetical protein CB0940_12247 [Cercospora beticola]WPB03938.1 hypothetical protein RHO25_008582 [Cercospora beticola]